MNQAPFFNAQFFDDDGTPLAGGFLYTYASGTTTPQDTYEDQAGEATNENPIELDAAGRCDLWLDPDLEYTFRLERADETLVKTWDNIVGVAGAADAVTSVNDLTGAVEITAEEIPFTTGTSTIWFEGTDVAAALDDIITKLNDVSTGSTTAADVAIVDSGAYFTATNVETALAELAVDVAAGFTLPTQTGNSGKFLTTNGTAPSWAAASLAAFTVDIGADISVSVAAGNQPYGTRSATVTGGTAPYTYAWLIAGPGASVMGISSGSASSTNISGTETGTTITATLTCFVSDSTGRMTMDQVAISATHA